MINPDDPYETAQKGLVSMPASGESNTMLFYGVLSHAWATLAVAEATRAQTEVLKAVEANLARLVTLSEPEGDKENPEEGQPTWDTGVEEPLPVRCGYMVGNHGGRCIFADGHGGLHQGQFS